jgi:hypothetical protein
LSPAAGAAADAPPPAWKPAAGPEVVDWLFARHDGAFANPWEDGLVAAR